MKKIKAIIIVGVILGLLTGFFIPYIPAFQFPLGFGFVGVSLSFFCLNDINLSTNKIKNSIYIVLMFFFGGMAYASLLNAAFEMPISLLDIPLHYVFIPIAAASFVYIFCLSVLSSKLIFRKTLLVLIYSSVIIAAAISLFYYYKWTSFAIANFLVMASLILISISFFINDSFQKVKINLTILVLFILVLPIIIPKSLIPNGTYIEKTLLIIVFVATIFTLLGNIVFLIAKFNKRFTGKVVIEWLVTFFSIILNYIIVGSLLSILPYGRASKYLRFKNQLTQNDIKISRVFAFNTFVINLIFSLAMNFKLSGIWRGEFDGNLLIWNSVIWAICTGLASAAIGKVIFKYKSQDYQ